MLAGLQHLGEYSVGIPERNLTVLYIIYGDVIFDLFVFNKLIELYICGRKLVFDLYCLDYAAFLCGKISAG